MSVTQERLALVNTEIERVAAFDANSVPLSGVGSETTDAQVAYSWLPEYDNFGARLSAKLEAAGLSFSDEDPAQRHRRRVVSYKAYAEYLSAVREALLRH